MVGAGQADSDHPHGVLWFWMQIASELLPKSFLCSCAAKVHQVRVEISHPPMASVHLRPAVLMVGVGRGRDRGLSLTLCVAGQGLAAKLFFQCRSPAVSSQILLWVCFCRARVCRVPECLLLTGYTQWRLYGVYSSSVGTLCCFIMHLKMNCQNMKFL